MRSSPALSITFFLGIALLAAGQYVPSFQASAIFSLLGGTLLIVVAIRALASLAGLHQESRPRLDSDETLLVESHNVTVQTRTWLFGARRGPYRARLTNRRVLLSLRVMLVMSRHDVTVAWLAAGHPLSARAIEFHGAEISIQPARRFGARWRLWLPNSDAWHAALAATHPELL